MEKKIKLYPMTINSLGIHKEIDNLAKTIDTYWNNDEIFGYYLLEKKPDTYHSIAWDLLVALEKNPEHHKIYIIRDQVNKDLWYILLKNYSEKILDDPVLNTSYLPQSFCPNVEVSYRTLQKWICARILRSVIEDYWQKNEDIKCLLWHHAIDNKASGLVFAHNGFSWLRYHKKYVYMPNIDQRTDTIMRILERETFTNDIKNYQEYQTLKTAIKSDPIRIYSPPHDSHQKINDWYDETIYQNKIENLSFNSQ